MFRRRSSPSPPPGADFAYSLARQHLEAQLRRIDELDRKLGVAIAAATALLIALARIYSPESMSHPDAWFSANALLAGVVALLLSLIGFLVRKYEEAPDPARIAAYVGDAPSQIRWQALPAVLKAIADNQVKLQWKGRLLNVTLVALGVVGLAELGSLIARFMFSA